MKSEPATVASATNTPTDNEARRPGLSNSPTHGPSRLPRSQGWSSRAKLLIAGGAALLVVVVALGTWQWLHAAHTVTRHDLELYKVGYDRIELTIIERGA